jgi:AraC-like DNA-binding protein
MVKEFLIKDFIGENEDISIDFYMEHRNINMHFHEFWEISYVYEGRGLHYYQNGNYEHINDGEFVFVSPGMSHCIVSPPADKGGWVRVCNVLMTQKYVEMVMEGVMKNNELDVCPLSRMISDRQGFCIHLKDEPGSLLNMMMTAAHEYKHFMVGSDEIINNMVMSMFLYIIRAYDNNKSNHKVENTKNDVICNLIRYIKSNFGSPITLDFLAAYVHLSPEYLSRYFKKQTGENLSEYITKTRIEKAKFRLRTTMWSINDIAEYCGYRSISNFQKAFKKYTGMSAGEYRKLCFLGIDKP